MTFFAFYPKAPMQQCQMCEPLNYWHWVTLFVYLYVSVCHSVCVLRNIGRLFYTALEGHTHLFLAISTKNCFWGRGNTQFCSVQTLIPSIPYPPHHDRGGMPQGVSLKEA